MATARAEAGRILMQSSGHTGIIAEDKAYLMRLWERAPDWLRRCRTAGNEVIARSREAIVKARRSRVMLGF